MTNKADILRNAPEGLKLYSSAFGDCKLSRVIEDEITIEWHDDINPDYVTLDQYGRFKFDGECILFPHKFNLHSWNGWQAWLFRDELSIGKVVVDTIGGCFIIIRSEKDNIKVANSNGEEFVIESRDVDKYRFATIEDSADFLSKVGKNNCHWSNVEKTIIKNTHCCEPKYDTDEEPKEFCDEDAKEAANIWCRCFKCDGIVNETGLKCDKTRLLTCPKWYDSYKASLIALETYNRKLKENKEPKELPYSDAEAKEFASKVSHEWWQMVMNEWNTLTEDEKKKYNQYIGFNDFSDHLMNILRSVLLGLKRNGKLIYEEGSLFSEPDQKPTEIELDETPIPCYEPKYFSCTGNCGNCVYHTTAGCSKKIEYDKSGCVSSGNYNSACATKNNKYVPKLKVGDKACLSDKNDNIYFEEILKANDEEYYTKTFGWINCKAIDELHEINFKEYNKPFTIGDFKQFDRVLWRLGPADTWTIGLYDNYYIAGENDKVSYSVLGYEKDWVPQCVPYNIDTAYLHDTDKEYDGKYKTW